MAQSIPDTTGIQIKCGGQQTNKEGRRIVKMRS